MRGILLLLAFSVALTGCDDKKAPVKGVAKKAKTAKAEPVKKDPAVDDIPFDVAKSDDPARMPKKPAKEPIEVSVRAVLVSHVKAEPSTSARHKAAALRRAQRISAAARKLGVDVEELAKRFSDLPEDRRTSLRVAHRGPLEMDPKFIDAALALGVQQVSEVVETKQGFWVMQRVDPGELSTAHILVIYQGAKLASGAVKRNKAQALALAERCAKRAKAAKEPFPVLAGRLSDSPSKFRGGVITPIAPHRMLPGFEPYYEVAKKLKVGEVSDVVETPYGFHVIKRLRLKKIMVRHILIRHDHAARKPEKRRKKHVAKVLALKLRKQAKEGADFAKLAREQSEDSSAEYGGLMAPFARGQMVPRFEQFAFALKVGRISEVVETKYGFHVIKRER
ncbi:MAG: peptidylprolyl isomerase [Deltaproteobacteria bacterium]|nr:peptidylprolyl isomerase [Deltaproteobacteria bacterium]